MRLTIALIVIITNLSLKAQDKIAFYASDSLKVTANLYLKDYQLPFIILLHQTEASRGEYDEIAPKLLNLNYNCLAVDLRSGGKMNYVSNETAQRAREQNYPARFIDAQKDIDAAIRYVEKISEEPVILFGSSYSASLSLLTAATNNRIKAVIAFSPGEYFRPTKTIKNQLNSISIPVFASATQLEYPYVKEMLSAIRDNKLIVYKPTNGRGAHGAKMLWDENENSSDCWWQLTAFFKRLEE